MHSHIKLLDKEFVSNGSTTICINSLSLSTESNGSLFIINILSPDQPSWI